MATKAEQARQALKEAEERYVEERAKYDADNNPPDAEQMEGLRALKAAIVTAREESNKYESFATMQNEWRDEENARHNSPLLSSLILPRGSTELLRRPSSLGQRFTENPTFKEWLKMVAPSGNIAESLRGFQSPPQHFKGLADFRMNSTLVFSGDAATKATGATTMVERDMWPDVVSWYQRPLNVRSVITNAQTESDIIDYVRLDPVTNNAAVVAEATATAGASGTKPESAMAFTRISEGVRTIAHWIPATKRALADASQLRSLIDSFLRYGVEEKLEQQIIAGDGVGENFDGMLNTAGIQTQAWDTDILTTTRRALTKVRTVAHRTANAYILNPADVETIALMKMGTGQFYFGGPGPYGSPSNSLWGLPVVESDFIPAGTGLVGDFTQCVLWDREAATITATDSHADFFIRNIVAILCELRAAFGVLQPNAIVSIDLTAA